MLTLTSAELGSLLGHVWWPFCRLMGAFTVLPMFSSAHLPMRAKILLALVLSVVMAPMVPAPPQVDATSLTAALLAAEQILTGIILAFPLLLLLHALTVLGSVVSMQMGLSMAVMNDPVNGMSQAIISQLLMLYGILMFLVLEGHLVALGILVDSFTLWPVGSGVLNLPLEHLVQRLGWMFAAALTLAIPAVTAMLLVNLTFGVLSRAAPSFNIFALGFPMSMMMGLVCLLLVFTGLPSLYSELTSDALRAMLHAIGGTP
ncbi:flagellar biosynthetic protein FliR [Ferrimonas sediminicola]|uniref:Flagellar biosynthetic protein FliR n=1 Tax=Ferrimonas sediminicola TaxID=2569538 RepID=A0A4U1BAI2_9GAMM|nr:flagellar biosynthetic protein FliR [Ferrimonas sediminicola]TKB47777.1 flagellar biosynthetic protein FliR [Ferrimonas sediminicola]